MSLKSFLRNKILANQINKNDITTMIAYIKCVFKQLKYTMLSLFKRCFNYARQNKNNYESFVSLLNFDSIDRAMTKLNKEEIKIKII